jgi:hypothetical protein
VFEDSSYGAYETTSAFECYLRKRFKVLFFPPSPTSTTFLTIIRREDDEIYLYLLSEKEIQGLPCQSQVLVL